MKNYYEILEVSKHASPEVIEKAYKALAKKYHPDVQTSDKLKWAEDKFKEIGEAYDILSNDEKRSSYDLELENEFDNAKIDSNVIDSNNSIYEDLQAQNQELEREIDSLKIKNYNHENNNISTEEITNIINNATNKAYQDAYIKRLKDYGYKIKYKKSFKTKFKNFITLLITILVLISLAYILWHIPSVKKIIVDFCNNNDVLKLIINLFN